MHHVYSFTSRSAPFLSRNPAQLPLFQNSTTAHAVRPQSDLHHVPCSMSYSRPANLVLCSSLGSHSVLPAIASTCIALFYSFRTLFRLSGSPPCILPKNSFLLRSSTQFKLQTFCQRTLPSPVPVKNHSSILFGESQPSSPCESPSSIILFPLLHAELQQPGYLLFPNHSSILTTTNPFVIPN